MADFIRDFFVANRVIVLSIYGQVFFVLGLAIALRSWRHSRLALARNLKWLAAFGFSHGLHEWGDVFIPLQAQYLAAPFIDLLRVLQVILLAISFTCLFQFGIENLRPLPDNLWLLRYIPGVVFALWLFVAFRPTLAHIGNVEKWYQFDNIWARYSICFPGALLAAYGLRRQARALIAPMEMPQIWRTLQVAGLALAVYAVMGGLAGPPSNFFPANRFNGDLVEQWTLIPVQVYRSVLGLILTLAIIQALEVFRVELDRRLSHIEETQVLIAERERIGRELHDGTLQTIYAAGLLLRTSERELLQYEGSANFLTRLQQSLALLNQAVTDIRGYIGSLQTQPSSRSLAVGLRKLTTADHLRSLVDVELELNLPEDQPLTPGQVGHLLAIANESLSNVVRHADATQVRLMAKVVGNLLYVEITDNGRGLPSDYVVGYGLRNIRDRVRMLNGEMALKSKASRGTTITVEVPWGERDETSIG